jgi:hypothetical protein
MGQSIVTNSKVYQKYKKNLNKTSQESFVGEKVLEKETILL